MTLVIIISLIFFGVLGGGAFFVFKKIKETDPQNVDSSISPNAATAQEFLPFVSIKDNMIDIGNHQYRAVIECSSVNYHLKTEREKEVIEGSFQSFLNGLNHPIWIFIQTRIIDNTKMLEKLKVQLQETVNENPQMTEYANFFYENMKQLNGEINNNKQKKKYIVVPYDEVLDMPNLSEEEKYNYSLDEIMQRAFIIASGLETVGMKCEILNTRKLEELIYSSYHKDNYSDAEFLSDGEFTKLIVDGKNIHQNMSKDALMDIILYEAQMRIANEVAGNIEEPELKKDYERVIRDLNQLRDKNGAYYKSGR